MKDIVVEQAEDKSFKPLKVSFVIESEEELADLYCRLNIPNCIIKKNVDDIFAYYEKPREDILNKMHIRKVDELFDIIDDYIEANLPNFFQKK